MATSAVIEEAGYVAVTAAEEGAEEGHTLPGGHLWFRLAEIPEGALFIQFEPVWGRGPDSLSSMWGKKFPIRNGKVIVTQNRAGHHREQPFTLGLRFRYVLRDGSVSAPSNPVFINYAGSAASRGGIRNEQLLLLSCLLFLSVLWMVYTKSSTSEERVRFLALLSLVSLLFLALTPALSWMQVQDPKSRYASIDCKMGDEVQCATYAPDNGTDPLMEIHESSSLPDRKLEIEAWVEASRTMRFSLILCLMFLLPTLIWLSVAPGVRLARGGVVLGAFAMGYCLVSAIRYRMGTPSWLQVEYYETFFLSVLTISTILLSSGLILFWSVVGKSYPIAPSLPRAKARDLS